MPPNCNTNTEEITQFEDLIQGKCEVNSRNLNVLCDSSAVHSFIFHECVDTLRLSTFELPYVLIVPIPTNNPTRTSQVYLKCQFQIDNKFCS